MSAAAQQAKPTPAPAPIIHPKKMTLQSIVRGKFKGPLRLIIHGVDGVGKSTFGANAPRPVFVGPEDGTEHLDTERFPVPETWAELLEAVHTLTEDKHEYQTLVIDSLDWAEPLLFAAVCKRVGVTTIEEVGGGYGKGYTAALDEWRVFLRDLERLQRERKMNVILLAHSFIKAFRNPMGEDFDRYILKLNEKAAGVLREWCNGVYFANYETFAVKDKAKRVRGVSTGARMLYTQRTAAYDAKDRYGLPEELPLSWEAFEKARTSGVPVDAATLTAEVQRRAELLDEETKKQALGAIERAGGDAQKLAQLVNWINAKAAEKAGKES